MNSNKGQPGCILLLLLTGCLGMAAAETLLHLPYFAKSAVKAVLFLALPLLGLGKQVLAVLRPRKGGLLRALALGLGVYALILGAYFLVRPWYDFSPIAGQLATGAGVSRDNFLPVSLYISFCNSLLEEFFFRGMGFLLLAPRWGELRAGAFSAALFALYHVAIIAGWFSPLLFVLVLAGLFCGGVLFQVLDRGQGNIFPSWMVHMWANFAINTVGFLLFDLL